MFFRGSRYEAIPDAEHAGADGRIVRYKRVRFVPATTTASQRYVVRDGDRPDLAAAATLGDAERFWQLCDANGVLRPADLTAAPGKVIAVPAPGDL